MNQRALVPSLVMPPGSHAGVDPVHLGVVFLVNLQPGVMHPRPVSAGIGRFLAGYRFKRPSPTRRLPALRAR